MKIEYLPRYKNIRKNKDLLAYPAVEKYNTFDTIIKEYKKKYLKEDISDNWKVVFRIVDLYYHNGQDKIQLKRIIFKSVTNNDSILYCHVLFLVWIPHSYILSIPQGNFLLES